MQVGVDTGGGHHAVRAQVLLAHAGRDLPRFAKASQFAARALEKCVRRLGFVATDKNTLRLATIPRGSTKLAVEADMVGETAVGAWLTVG